MTHQGVEDSTLTHLLTASANSSLAHCVEVDLLMGAGFAVDFRRKYGRIEHKQQQKFKGLA